MPGKRAAASHPDNDLLADLAAQTLAPDLAARVAQHVEGCEQCAHLLDDAERMTQALRALPFEPMPADIGQRLDRALAAERAHGGGSTDLAAPPTRAMPVTPARATPPEYGTDWIQPAPPAAPPPPPPSAPVPTPSAGTRTGELPTRRSLRAANTGGLDTGSMSPGPASASSPAGSGSSGVTGPQTVVPRDDPGTDPGASPATGSTRRIPIAGRGTPGPATGSTARVSEGAFARLTRPGGRDRQGARRQALEEQRSDQPSRIGPMLRVAAGVVLVLAVGAGVYKVISGGDDSATTAASSPLAVDAAGAAPVLAPVLTTGTDYQTDDLTGQIHQLVDRSQKAVSAVASGDQSRTQSSGGEVSAPETSSSGNSAGSGGNLLTSNAALRACLTGLGEPDAQPVAVDLASYRGQEAAILVLPEPNGTYTVWVVGRNCNAQDQSEIDQQTVTP